MHPMFTRSLAPTILPADAGAGIAVAAAAAMAALEKSRRLTPLLITPPPDRLNGSLPPTLARPAPTGKERIGGPDRKRQDRDPSTRRPKSGPRSRRPVPTRERTAAAARPVEEGGPAGGPRRADHLGPGGRFVSRKRVIVS